jgi:hypothetical protein
MFIFLWNVKSRNLILDSSLSYPYIPNGTKEIFPVRFLSFEISTKIPGSKRALRVFCLALDSLGG